MALSELKNRKAEGKDWLPAELLKALSAKAKWSYMIFAMKYMLVMNGQMIFLDSVIIPVSQKAWIARVC